MKAAKVVINEKRVMYQVESKRREIALKFAIEKRERLFSSIRVTEAKDSVDAGPEEGDFQRLNTVMDSLNTMSHIKTKEIKTSIEELKKAVKGNEL